MNDTLTLAHDQGQATEIEGGWEVRFERRLRHSPERVWAALTTPQGLACWLAEAEIEPGGRMTLDFRQPATEKFPDTPEVRRQANEVLFFQPFTRFDHTFGAADSVVSWRLSPDGDGTHLTLIHRMARDWEANVANTLAGWHHHMEGLDAAARGVAHPWSWPRWTALRDGYAGALAQ